jgi:hypothetical protein
MSEAPRHVPSENATTASNSADICSASAARARELRDFEQGKRALRDAERPQARRLALNNR